jgi:hypothetical protein
MAREHRCHVVIELVDQEAFATVHQSLGVNVRKSVEICLQDVWTVNGLQMESLEVCE